MVVPAIPKPEVFYRQKPDGSIEGVDPITGAVVVSGGDLYHTPEYATFVEQEIDGQKVLVQSGITSPNLPRSKRFPFSQALADIICQKIVSGVLLSKMHEIENMPDNYVISLWRKNNRDFDEQVKWARRVRAETLRDEAMALSRDAVGLDKDSVPGQRLAIETLKWAAEKDDPSTYGSKVSVEGAQLVQLIINTGIRRPGDPGFDPINITPTVEIVKRETIEEGKNEPTEEILGQGPKNE